MVGEAAAAVSGLKGVYEIAKGFISIRDAAMIQSQAVELLGKISAAQESALRAQEREFALTKRIDELETEIAQMEKWEAEKERYELAELPPGVFVYALKADASRAEPAHKLCANCFDKNKKAILHAGEASQGITRLHCPSCGNDYRVGRFVKPTNPPRNRPGTVRVPPR